MPSGQKPYNIFKSTINEALKLRYALPSLRDSEIIYLLYEQEGIRCLEIYTRKNLQLNMSGKIIILKLPEKV